MSDEIKVVATRLDAGLLADARLSFAIAPEVEYVRADIADELLAAIKGVLRVADRKTVEFDAARAAIARATAA